MELTKPFSPRPSKSLHHFNFLLGCSIGVLGESGEYGGRGGGKGADGRETANKAGRVEREHGGGVESRLYQPGP